ncbi:MAG: hypothetical protein WAN36_10115 [Calditrichia bacterium]
MDCVYKLGWILSLLLMLQLPGFSQTDRLFLDLPPDTFITTANNTLDSLQLPATFLIPGSERIQRNDFRLLRGIHYQMDYRQGVIFFQQPPDTGDLITVLYRSYPFPLIPSFSHRQLQFISDSAGTGTETGLRGAVRSRFFEEMDSFSENLQRSGSLVRGFEIGSNRDLTLNSGLNLQLSGYITPRVQLVAALTDESTPIQPEGNTQTLREVDKVFVKISSPYLGGTLGDFNLDYRNSRFGNLQRKLQGITANGDYQGYHQQLTYATSRGNFNTNQFLGQEGNQGPYQLRGKNGERDIIVLAGTERVYVNGLLQTRGENNDYTIDYSLGQITFSNKRLITSEDRVEADFEYANVFQRYGKSFLGVSSDNTRSGKAFQYDIRLFREWDDTRNLLEDSAPLSDEEKQALASAGDDPLQASVGGAELVGAGNGNYSKQDTVLNGEIFTYYRYEGRGEGEYAVRFTGVGFRQGSYLKERLGVYRFVGPEKGDYLPVRLVPLAGDKKLADAVVSYRLGESFVLNGEGAVSLYDRNVYSDEDDEDNAGISAAMGAAYDRDDFSLFGRKAGVLNWKADWRLRQQRFSPLDRQYQPEFNYKWNLQESDLQGDEQTLESVLIYQPSGAMQLDVDGGIVELGDAVSSRRGRGSITFTDSTRLSGRGFLEAVASEDSLQESTWIRSGATLSRLFWKGLPYAGYRQEDRQVNTFNHNQTGFYFTEKSAGIKLFSILGANWTFGSQFRDDYLYNPHNPGEKLKLSVAATHRLSLQLMQAQKWQGRASVVYRDKDYKSFFEQMPPDSLSIYQPNAQFQDTSWADRKSHLANLEIQYRNRERTVDSRWEYKAASELQALQEKVFLEVGENRGNYRYDEILQEYVPDPQGSYFLVIVPTGNFESITNVEASWQLRYRPPAENSKKTGWSRLFSNISTFTYLKVDEKSREQNIWQLYLLNLSKFHNQNSTVSGTYTINQDVYLFERNPEYGFTLRNRYTDNLSNQYVEADFNESRTYWERSLSWRQQIYKRLLSHELQYSQIVNQREVSSAPGRNRDIFGNSGELKLNYRPVYAWQFRWELEAGWQRDRAIQNRLFVRYYQLRPQVNYAIKGKARIQSSFTYLRVDILDNPLNRPIPFEMGKGKRQGNSFLWNFRFEYFVSTNVTVTVNYTGRSDAAAARTIHLGQAEVRAFF